MSLEVAQVGASKILDLRFAITLTTHIVVAIEYYMT
jgi:hypothetical protein